jgi:hypothetical protein
MSVSVHSLYYIDMATMVKKLDEQVIKTHIAVVHDYENWPTKFYGGELEVEYNATQMRLRAKGNAYDYIHARPWWVGSTFIDVPDSDYTLVTTLLHKVGDDAVIMFRLAEGKYEAPVFVPEAVSNPAVFDVEKCCKDSYRVNSVIDKFTLRKFVDSVGEKAHAAGADRLDMQLYAHSWFNKHVADIAANTTLTIETEEAISQINSTLTTMTSDATKWQRWFRKWCKSEMPYIYLAVLIIIFLLFDISTVAYAIITLMVGLNRGLLSMRYCLYDYCKGIDEVPPLDPSKCKYFPPVKSVECQAKVKAYPMIMVNGRIPAIPRSCYHNFYTAIRNRMLAPIDASAKEWSKVKMPPELIKAAASIAETIKPLQFEEWLGRFPPSKQKSIRREYEMLAKTGTRRANDTKVFLKFEAAKNQTKHARCISSSEPEFNFQVGRWIGPLTELLAEYFHKDNDVFFPLAANGEEIAEHLSRYESYVENDFSSFDSTQSKYALGMVYDFYAMCGMPDDVIALLKLDLEYANVSTRVGLRFKAGGFRFSGRGDTLGGNGVLNYIVMYHAYMCMILRMIFKGDDSVIDAPNGDDNLAIQRLTRLGFKAKLVRKTINDVEFCSKLLVPVNGGFAMGPKIGRILAKTFWCKNTQLTTDQMKTRLRGVILGLKHDITFVPVLKQLLEITPAQVPITTNPYAITNAKEHEMSYDTLRYYANRYGLTVGELNGIELDLTTFPIVIDQEIIRRMVDVDWSDADNMELLGRKFHVSYMDILIMPIIEELFKYYFGFAGSLVIGLIESYHYGSVRNLILHCALGRLPLILAVFLHMFHNYFASGNLLSVGPAVKMANKNNTRRKNKPKGKQQQQRKPAEQQLGPLIRKFVAQGLRSGGQAAGNYIAPGVGGQFGRAAGAGISQILGFGDYTVKSNTLSNAPQFGKTPPTFRVKNREFVGDVISSVGFSAVNHVINPGNRDLFPWLSSIAAGYQQYKVNGMVMYFNTTSATSIGSTNTAMGTIMMSTDYDLAEAAYSSKQEVLASYFSTSGVPSQDLIHAIECDPKQRPIDVLYVDHAGESADDPALFNLGNFQIATAGMQAASTIGELWISYDITFFKPRMSSGNLATLYRAGPWTAASPLGVLVTTPFGTPVEISSSGPGFDTVSLLPYRGRVIQVTVLLSGTSLVSPSVGAVYTNCAGKALFDLSGTSFKSNLINSGTAAAIYFISVPLSGSPPSVEINVTLSSGTPTFSNLYIMDVGPLDQVE